MTHPSITRRVLLTAGAGVSAAALAACSSPTPHSVAAGSAGGSLVPPGTVLFALADIPVGGSVSAEAAGQPLLIAQPSSGTVVAYSAVCTHQGCVVAAQGMRFVCPCHGSQFDAATGAVLAGPASRPLTPVAVTVSGGDVEAGT